MLDVDLLAFCSMYAANCVRLSWQCGTEMRHPLQTTLFLLLSFSLPLYASLHQPFGGFVCLLCCRCVKEFGSRDALLYASVFPQNKVG